MAAPGAQPSTRSKRCREFSRVALLVEAAATGALGDPLTLVSQQPAMAAINGYLHPLARLWGNGWDDRICVVAVGWFHGCLKLTLRSRVVCDELAAGTISKNGSISLNDGPVFQFQEYEHACSWSVVCFDRW